MDSRGLVFFIIALVLGAIVGGSVVFINYFPQLDLGREVLVVDSGDYNELLVEYEELHGRYVELNYTSFSLSLRKEYLDSELLALSEENEDLSNNYREVLSYTTRLSGHLIAYGELIQEYSDFDVSLKKSMDMDEIFKLSDKVTELTRSLSKWDSHDAINLYVQNNISYTEDTPFPYISNYKSAQYNGSELITDFKIEYLDKYIDVPSFTLLRGSGDALDKAILDYAMMKNYQITKLKNETKLYLALITFSDGQESACIIKKEKEYVHIFDPNSVFYQWRVTFYTPEHVLSVYENFWSNQGKQIDKIRLIVIGVTDSQVSYVFEGNINDLIDYFTK